MKAKIPEKYEEWISHNSCSQALLSQVNIALTEGDYTLKIKDLPTDDNANAYIERMIRLCQLEDLITHESDKMEINLKKGSSYINIKFFYFFIRLLATAKSYCDLTVIYNIAGIYFHQALLFAYLAKQGNVKRLNYFKGYRVKTFLTRSDFKKAFANSKSTQLDGFFQEIYNFSDTQLSLTPSFAKEINELALKGKGKKIRNLIRN